MLAVLGQPEKPQSSKQSGTQCFEDGTTGSFPIHFHVQFQWVFFINVKIQPLTQILPNPEPRTTPPSATFLQKPSANRESSVSCTSMPEFSRSVFGTTSNAFPKISTPKRGFPSTERLNSSRCTWAATCEHVDKRVACGVCRNVSPCGSVFLTEKQRILPASPTPSGY